MVEIEKCQQPPAWFFAVSADALVGSLFIFPGKCNHLLLSKRSEKCSRSLAVFRTPTELGWLLAQHAWYLGSSCMIPTTAGSAGVQQLLPLLKLRWHPSYERTSIPHHFSFIPKPYSPQATFDTTCTSHLCFKWYGFTPTKTTKTEKAFVLLRTYKNWKNFMTKNRSKHFLLAPFCSILWGIKRG